MPVAQDLIKHVFTYLETETSIDNAKLADWVQTKVKPASKAPKILRKGYLDINIG